LGFLDSIKSIFLINRKDQRSINYFAGLENVASMSTKKALTFSAVWAAIRLLSESVSGLPISVYKKDANGDKTEDTSSPLYTLLKYKPNTYMNKITFFEKIMMDLLCNGNSYVRIVRNGAATPVELLCLDYDNVDILIQNNYLYYQVSKKETYDSSDILHFKLITEDGITGLSPITQNAKAINWGMDVEEFGRKFFTNGASMTGVLETSRSLSTEAIDRLKNSFNQTYSGIKNSSKTAVLEEGLTFKPISVSAEQAQFLSSRTFSIEEVARIFNIPPHLLKDLSRSSFNNIEQQGAEFVIYSLMPYISKIEEEFNLKLFKRNELGKSFVEFNVMGLLRGSVNDRSNFYKSMFGIGVMSINEIRRKENMNAIEGGDEHFMPLNMTTLKNIENAS
jgi:HK97 family phage portal protein